VADQTIVLYKLRRCSCGTERPMILCGVMRNSYVGPIDRWSLTV